MHGKKEFSYSMSTDSHTACRFQAGATCPHTVHWGKQVNGTSNNTAGDQQSAAGCTWLTYLQQSYSSLPSPPGDVPTAVIAPLQSDH